MTPGGVHNEYTHGETARNPQTEHGGLPHVLRKLRRPAGTSERNDR